MMIGDETSLIPWPTRKKVSKSNQKVSKSIQKVSKSSLAGGFKDFYFHP